MTEKISPSRNSRRPLNPYDRDQLRVPTFQVLMDQVKVQQNTSSRGNKRAETVSPHASSPNPKSKEFPVNEKTNHRKRGNARSPVNNNYAENNRQHHHLHHHHHPHSPNPQISTFPEIHQLATKSSKESLSSNNGYRGPACDFSNRKSDFTKTRSSSLVRNYSLVDEVDDEEPTDVVVWNTDKKMSRPNILCPLTDSELINLNCPFAENSNTTNTRRRRSPMRRERSNSFPRVKKGQIGDSEANELHLGEIVAQRQRSQDDMLKVNLLDDPFAMEKGISRSISMASNYSASSQIATVTLQLEAIHEAQNDVLKNLGTEIAKVTNENDDLRSEVARVKNQNEGLLEIVKNTTEELERMRHIFLLRGLSSSSPCTKTCKSEPMVIDKQPVSSGKPSPTKKHSKTKDKFSNTDKVPSTASCFRCGC